MSFLSELRRRNVFRAAAAYAATAWLLIEVAETTLPAFGFGEGVLRIVIVALAIGFVPVVVAAWVFQITPEGLKRERDLDRSEPRLHRTNRLLDRAIVAVLTAALTLLAIDKFLLDPARDAAKVEAALEQGRSEAAVGSYGDRSIVVLPFANLSANPDQAFFADGMAEELLNLLAKVPELRVISRTSAFAFKGRKDLGIAAIAKELKVSHVLEGSVRRSGDRLRVTAQLIDAGTDRQLWSETYDRTLDDIFTIQDDIAARVVEQLELRLIGAGPRAKRVDPQAYMLYMQARQLLDSFDEDYGRIHDLLRRALEIDPRYADAWTGIGWIYYRYRVTDDPRRIEFFRNLTAEDAERLRIEAGETALALDPDNAIAHAYSASLKAFDHDDLQGAADQFARALQHGPEKSDVLRPAIIFARHIRRPDIAIRLGEYAIARDPLCGLCAYQLARAYLDAGRLDAAETAMRNFAATGRGGWHTIGTILLLKGEAQAALQVFEQHLPADGPEILHGRALALHALGRREESHAALEALEADWAGEAALIAQVYAWTRDFEVATQWLERAAASPGRAPTSRLDWSSPFLRAYFEQPDGQALLRRYGVAPEQLAEIAFEVSLPGSATPRNGSAG